MKIMDGSRTSINAYMMTSSNETFSVLLAICAGISPVTGEFPAKRPVTRSFDVFFDVRLNKRLSQQSWGWWFEAPSRRLWHHCNELCLHELTHWPLGLNGQYFADSIFKFVLTLNCIFVFWFGLHWRLCPVDNDNDNNYNNKQHTLHTKPTVILFSEVYVYRRSSILILCIYDHRWGVCYDYYSPMKYADFFLFYRINRKGEGLFMSHE